MDQKPLWSAPGAFLAQVDEDIIVLDLAGDRYEGLLDVGRSVQLDGRGGILAADEDVYDALLRSGVAVKPDGSPARAPITAARRELAVDPHPPRSDILRAAIVLSSATLRFRGKSLDELVSLRHPLRGPAPRSPDRLSQLVGAARAARPWIPFEGECLQRSFLLRAWLAAQGVATDWIFGVRTWPFAAHCWLQIDDLVVGDRLERASRFVPIMRV